HGALRPRRAHRRLLPAGVLRGDPLRARAALPGRDPCGGCGRVLARAQCGERRPPRGAAGRGRGNARPRAHSRIRARPGRDVGVRQGRRGRQVLHVGVAMTRDRLTRVGIRGHRSAHGYCAPNYDPLPVTLTRGSGAWVEDDHGHRYLDFLSAYSALNFGHCHPRLVATARRQLTQLTLAGRAYGTDNLEPFCRDLAGLCGMEMVVPMNTGAEAVETAIKVARRWGYTIKGVPDDHASIIVCTGNFHGRTTTIAGFSSDPATRSGFGPFTPGFVSVPSGDAGALSDAITDSTVAVLL